MMGGAMGQQQSFPQATGAAIPPPMPNQVMYYYAVNGAQQGPVSLDQLRSLFAGRTINRESLVWKQGMANWTALQDVEELKSFLGGNTPPPLPNS